jgi:V8-like Glu-specific endopeptidase
MATTRKSGGTREKSSTAADVDQPRVREDLKNEEAMDAVGTTTDRVRPHGVAREAAPARKRARGARSRSTEDVVDERLEELEDFAERQRESPALAKQIQAATERFIKRREERATQLELLRNKQFLAADSEERVIARALRVLEDRTGRELKKDDDEAQRIARRVRAARETQLGGAREVMDEPVESPAQAFERIIGTSDLQPINYLQRGERAQRAIGRVVVATGSYGTGFMVSPSLLMTNNHVLESAQDAAGSEVEFNYQVGADGKNERTVTLPLDPGKFFVTDEALDYSIVAVGGTAAQRRPFGYHKLIEKQGKIVNGEPVTIVQHPKAGRKQISLRENRVFDVLTNFLHYETDTEPGSSGSPVFNDAWQVVALHHAGVPGSDGGWVANEGVRISKVVADVRKQNLTGERDRLRDELLDIAPFKPEEIEQDNVPVNGGDGQQLTNAPQPALTSIAGTPVVLQIDSPPQRVTISIGQGAVLGSGAITASGGVSVITAPTTAGGGVAAVERFDTIPAASLRASDVLLYRGTSIISRGIQWFDSSEVSHASLYLGNLRTGEALSNGLVTQTLRDSFRDQEWVAARRLMASSTNMQPVLNVANKYLAQRLKYGYSQIVLLAILSLVRKLAPTGWTGWLIVAAVKAAVAALSGFLQRNQDLMICSEFVYRSYDEADPARQDPYTIRINDLPFEAMGGWEATGAALRRGRGIHPESALAGLIRDPGRVVEAMRPRVASAAEAIPSPAAQEQLEARVEDLLVRYINEVQTGPTNERAERTTMSEGELDQELAAAVGQFAVALAAAESIREGAYRTSREALEAASEAASQESLAGAIPASLQRLLRTAADFVTPGDLYKTQSLVTLGKVTGV